MSESFSDLKDKVVVIAGATGLIGKEVSKGFIGVGSTVVLASRNQEKGAALEKELNSLGDGKAVYHQLDIADEGSVDALIEYVVGEYSRVDVFINCSWPRTSDWMKNIEEVEFGSIKENLNNHLGGYFLCAQKFALQMRKQGSGSIINFSSTYGIVGPHFSVYEGTEMTSPPAYPLLKGGIITMTKYFATYFAKDGVRVNCISPGGIFDNQNPKFVKKYDENTPLGRMGKPEEIAGAALYLASDASSYTTGHNLVVDGGWTAW